MGDEQCVIHVIDPEQNWVSKVKNELTQLSQTRSTESERWEKQSIYRIPHSIKQLSRSAYEPQMVSIGPYHHGEPHLEAMEEHKHRALLTSLERSKKPLQSYVDALAPEVENLKDAYDQLEPKWRQDNEAFLQLMIVDGCFVLEIMRTRTKSESRKDYAWNDPVLNDRGNEYFIYCLMRDMLKLENQLPLWLLFTLLLAEGAPTVYASSKKDEAISLILDCYDQKPKDGNIKEFGACVHILDLYRKSLLLRLPPGEKGAQEEDEKEEVKEEEEEEEDDEFLLKASKLSQVGIIFKQSKTSNLNDISFCRGVLNLPRVVVDDALESKYLNMMAFEGLHCGSGDEVRSFVHIMSSIVNNAEDVSLLKSCGIIKNMLGSEEAVATLFTSISKDVSVDYYNWLEIKVSHYCRKPIPRWMAYAKQNYFNNPWVGISVFAAIILFALAGIQTVYSVLANHQK